MLAGRTCLAALVIGVWGAGGAHAATCEASASSKAGEAILTFDVSDADKSVRRVDVAWLPERKDGAGEESDHFARPALMLDYRMAADGALTGPAKAAVLISRHSGPDVGRAPKLSDVRVRARVDGVEAAAWVANDPVAGEAKLAAAIRESGAGEIALEIVDAGGRVQASSVTALAAAELKALAARVRAEFAGCG